MGIPFSRCLYFLEMLVKLTELIWENVCVWNEIEELLPEPFLHSNYILTKLIFSCNLVALREMIYLLILVQAFVEIAFTATIAP